MKIFSKPFIIIAIIILSACNGQNRAGREELSKPDSLSVPDTGYTGIKQYMSQQLLVKEVTFKNGVKEGLMKAYYQNGKLRTTFWYKNDLREDTSKWYYQEGQLFRATPYKRDTVDGTQIQYYRNGSVKAKLKYIKGLRTPYLEEFKPDGKLVTGYPELVVKTKDEYVTTGTYKITLSLSDNSTKLRLYRGEFTNGLFDTTQCKSIDVLKGIGTLTLKKSSSQNKDYIGVIAEILTGFGNNLLVYKKIDIPYNDLN